MTRPAPGDSGTCPASLCRSSQPSAPDGWTGKGARNSASSVPNFPGKAKQRFHSAGSSPGARGNPTKRLLEGKGRIPGNGPCEELTTIRERQPGRISSTGTVQSHRDALQGRFGVSAGLKYKKFYAFTVLSSL